jgi:lipoprotein-anchoring transpeptidase ErfK/SrfK
MPNFKSAISIAALIAAAALSCGAAQAQTYGQPYAYQVAPQDEATDQDAQLDPRLQRQIVAIQTHEATGTIIVDTANTYLYLVLGNGQAMRYGIGVGREGFTWAGVQKVARKAEWPDWYPPAEMIARQPYLPRVTLGGPGNPLGARALYLGTSEYRIHGTNDPTTIGKQVSSGCVRLTNEDVTDLYTRVAVGAKVVVLPMNGGTTMARAPAARPLNSAQAQPVSLTSSYGPARQSSAQQKWSSIGSTIR